MTHVLHNFVLPDAGDEAVHRLYLTADDGAAEIVGRTAVRLAPGAEASFGTYFNAFPASYWAHWTDVRDVVLTVEATGSGVIRVHRSNAAGEASLVAEKTVTDAATSVEVALEGFDAGGWVWFDVVASADGLRIERATWSTELAPQRPATAAIGITTVNKPDYCVRTLAALGGSTELDGEVERVFLIDQGDRLVTDHPDFATSTAALGDRLTVIRQANLGGSGGFSRAMAETLALPSAEFVLLLDDDVEIETESIRRAITFGAYCSSPTIVGGHMFDLNARTKLYAWAEVVDEHPFMWRPLHDDRMPIDLAESDLRTLPLVHERMDADYNGWWMCLIPREVIERIGLSIPVFIKWDDAEYGLRARDHGFATVSLPGAALWHVAWVGKDDQIDWQAYFHVRNRIVSALLHSEAPHGGKVLEHSRRVDLKHFMAMQYYPTELRLRALRAILSGPAHLHRELATVLPELRAIAKDFPETQPAHVDGALAHVAADWPADDSDAPTGLSLGTLMFRSLVVDWVFNTRRPAMDAEAVVPARQARWWRLAAFDSVIVAMAGSGEKRRYARDRAVYRRQLADSIRLHRQLHKRWDSLRDEYRAAPLTTLDQWTRTFSGAPQP